MPSHISNLHSSRTLVPSKRSSLSLSPALRTPYSAFRPSRPPRLRTRIYLCRSRPWTRRVRCRLSTGRSVTLARRARLAIQRACTPSCPSSFKRPLPARRRSVGRRSVWHVRPSPTLPSPSDAEIRCAQQNALRKSRLNSTSFRSRT